MEVHTCGWKCCREKGGGAAMNIQTATEIQIPQGNVKSIEQGGSVIWKR